MCWCSIPDPCLAWFLFQNCDAKKYTGLHTLSDILFMSLIIVYYSAKENGPHTKESAANRQLWKDRLHHWWCCLVWTQHTNTVYVWDAWIHNTLLLLSKSSAKSLSMLETFDPPWASCGVYCNCMWRLEPSLTSESVDLPVMCRKSVPYMANEHTYRCFKSKLHLNNRWNSDGMNKSAQVCHLETGQEIQTSTSTCLG